ncbi:hypothetical protein [Paenibacillus sp. TC-CSREp1]|uniref:hypothetical protein n=1 Tax=Paenibacillus sp. TC-CSREp1 TaxID=3410089 RepID=UPI003CED6571
MKAFDFDKLNKRNSRNAAAVLRSFIEIEVNEYSMSDIIQFLNHSSIGEELELTDHFIIRKNEDEVLVFNETTEMFVKNPEDYRVYVEISSLIYLMNQYMSQGLRKIDSLLKLN